MDAELEFAIQPSTTGKQLFDQVRTYSKSALSVLSYTYSICTVYPLIYLHHLYRVFSHTLTLGAHYVHPFSYPSVSRSHGSL